jgi:hypothetical protein
MVIIFSAVVAACIFGKLNLIYTNLGYKFTILKWREKGDVSN